VSSAPRGISLPGLIARRAGAAALTLLLVSAVVFAITSLLPGDAAEQALGQGATPETVAALRAQFGLDRPAPIRYATWLWGLVTGDPGTSMASGLPVVATAAGGTPEVLADGSAGVLVPIRNPTRLAQAMVALAADPGARARLATLGRRRVESSFTIQRMVAEYARLYHGLLD